MLLHKDVGTWAGGRGTGLPIILCGAHFAFAPPPPIICLNEACIGVLGIQDICHFTSSDIGYFPFYFQGYGILYSLSGILLFFLSKYTNTKYIVEIPITSIIIISSFQLRRKSCMYKTWQVYLECTYCILPRQRC